ncbi:MAG: cyclic pyranopterin monophosphate synthase MoaC [Sphingomonadaceae bacterium]
MAELTHLDENGAARMVDVGGKKETRRTAIAEGRIRMSPEALDALTRGDLPKGDAFAAARIAGIMAAKRTGELIPLCHPLALESVAVDFTVEDHGIRVEARATLTGRTGVEMEAMTAVSMALLTLYDMGKAVDRAMVIDGIRLLAKTGGKSGDWHTDR